MKPLTHNDAAVRVCPFTLNGAQGWNYCVVDNCMAWTIVHEEVRREDHSGARDVVTKYALETKRIMRREGGPGSSGFLVLDAVGVCARLEHDKK